MRFDGKKLLILGATSGETTLVRRAQSLGIYTVVTDSNLDYDLSPAKKLADEVWDISWSDIDALEKKCRETGIDGVTAGYSEFRVENLIKLCKRLGLPCYITEEQLEITRDKLRFKEACRQSGVPTVKEFASPEEVDEFPVIVKPVDRAGSIGISIASDRPSLDRAYAYAMEMSVCKSVIIEKYMEDRKVDVYYAVEDGEITLLTSCDTIPAEGNGREKVCQTCWLYPMAELSDYMKKVDGAARRMIRSMGIRYGCIFFSGFVDRKNDFVFFECGFRMEGAHQYGYTERRGPYHFLDLFIVHALTGETRRLRRTPARPELKAAVVNVYMKEGTIGRIDGAQAVQEMEDCCLMLVHARPGQVCHTDKAILNKAAVMIFANEDPARLKQDIDLAYSRLSITDTEGNDLFFDRVDTSLVENWWNGMQEKGADQ